MTMKDENIGEYMNIFLGIMIPFAGTALGAACVFLLKNDIRAGVQKALLGFASGIMVAASVWSLLIPAMEMSESMGKLRFVPAAFGFMVGILTLLLMDSYVPHQHLGQEEAEGVKKNWSRSMKMVMAVTIHNIPEGIATSVPIYYSTGSRKRAFIVSFFSGITEPLGAIIGYLILRPFFNDVVFGILFGIIAGIMVFISIEELLPMAREYEKSKVTIIGVILGMAIIALSLLLFL